MQRTELSVAVSPSRGTKRDAAATRERILKAGIAEFCAKGYGGARTANIAKRASCNIRMLYHYFGSKEKLYISALERVYGQIRQREQALNLQHLEPVAGLTALVEFTFDHMANHDDFVKLAMIENIQRGRFLKKSEILPHSAIGLFGQMGDLLRRGREQGVFHRVVDPVQLYVSILAMSYLHLSNRHTLSIMYDRNLADPAWIGARREHVLEMVLTYLSAPAKS